MNRWRDWWLQTERDLAHARHALDDGDYEWSAFAAQQGAEQALKAIIMASGGEARYPNGFAEGFPGQFYTRGEAEQAIADATSLFDFCRGRLPR